MHLLGGTSHHLHCLNLQLSPPRPRPTAMASNNSSSDRSERLREAAGPIHHLSDEAFNSLLLRLNDWVTSQDVQQHTVTEVFSDNTNLASAVSSMTGGSADGHQVLETPDIVGGVNSSNSYSPQPQEPSYAGSTPSLVLSEQRTLEDSSTATNDSSTTTGSTPISPRGDPQ
jgi:hypothetical protein